MTAIRVANGFIESDETGVDSPRLPLGDSAEERATAHVRAFDFTTDSHGRIDWAESGVAPMVAGFLLAQLHAPNLTGDGLGQLPKFNAPDALVRREPFARVGEDRLRRFPARLDALAQRNEGFRHGQPQRVGARHDRGF